MQKCDIIINMKNTRKIALLLILLIGLSTFAFGDTFYSMSGGFYRLYEQYTKEDYGRAMDGGNFIVTLNYYPEEDPLGWYLRTSFGGARRGFHWKGESMDSLYLYSTSDIQISAGPSYKYQLGSIIYIPLSLGPVFTNYREEFYGYNNDNFHRALDLGLMGDISVVINPYKWLTFINGINVSWDFLRWESGYVQSEYRKISSGRFRHVNYQAFKIGFYLGAGLRFNGISTNNTNYDY